MAKVNVNKATREELVDVAGLRPQVAEAILKAREEQGGRLKDVEALRELKGVGEATLEQLKDVLAFGATEAKEAAEKAAEVGDSVARAGAETAKAGADAARRTTERGAEVASFVARSGLETTGRAVRAAADAERQVAERSSEAAGELSRLVVSLVNEQLQANVETLQALARARTWRETLEIQNEFFRGNVERMTHGASRYVEAVTRLMAGMAQAGREETRKAA
jgi:competence ComEA-like helix-hairpin-helix protein